MRTLPFGVAVLAFVSLAAATNVTASPPLRAVLTGCDALAPSGVPARVRFKVERDTKSRYDLAGVQVEFRANGSLLGRAFSKSNGYAELTVNVPAGGGNLIVTGRVASTKYVADDETLLLAVRDAKKRVVVTDIDGTISALPFSQVVVRPNSELPPVRGAAKGLVDLAKDAVVVYLTAREDRYRAKTKDWLKRWGFPLGPVYMSDDDAGLGTQQYKTAALREVAPYFKNMKWGFGNKNTDARAYDANGLASFLFDTENAGPYVSFAEVARDWTDLRAANAAGRVPSLSWATSFR